MEDAAVGCLFVMFGAFFPRLAVLFIWLARPGIFEAAISSALVAVLGIIFLPFTTLMYVLLWTPAGLSGFDWVWLLLAFLLDIGGVLGSGYANRERAGGFYSGGSTG
jgi:hypothetical protein